MNTQMILQRSRIINCLIAFITGFFYLNKLCRGLNIKSNDCRKNVNYLIEWESKTKCHLPPTLYLNLVWILWIPSYRGPWRRIQEETEGWWGPPSGFQMESSIHTFKSPWRVKLAIWLEWNGLTQLGIYYLTHKTMRWNHIWRSVVTLHESLAGQFNHSR